MNQLNQRLVLCDLDHLLLGADGNLTQVVRDVLQLFVRRGGRFTVFSQRTPRAVRSILGSVRLNAPALVCGGAMAYHFADGTSRTLCSFAGQDADLTDPNVWTKLDYPLQKSGVYNGQWQLGTGHGMWSNDEDGNLIYVFHNAEYENGRYGGRDAQVRRVHWSKEGMPILDMQAAEELNPDYADITMKIVVSGNKG